ncbi:hypothetical protein D3C84_1138540 [compost metagenome]
MLLAGHALNGDVLLVPDRGDVQQHIRLPLALLGLMGLETIDWWRADDLLTGLIALCLSDDASFLGQMDRQRVIVVVRVF